MRSQKRAQILRLLLDMILLERIETEKRLKESEEKFSEIFHLSPIGMVITHRPEGRCDDAAMLSQDAGVFPEGVIGAIPVI